jgi:hypothetical protein
MPGHQSTLMGESGRTASGIQVIVNPTWTYPEYAIRSCVVRSWWFSKRYLDLANPGILTTGVGGEEVDMVIHADTVQLRQKDFMERR